MSLVAFRFLDTRVKGVPVPFRRDFDEINPRFYVNAPGPDGDRAGSVEYGWSHDERFTTSLGSPAISAFVAEGSPATVSQGRRIRP